MRYALPASTEFFVGLMSGTSLDGVDAVCCRFFPDFSCFGLHHEPMPAALRHDLLALQTAGDDETHRSMLAGLELAALYAKATERLLAGLGIPPTQVRAIGCHGQTIRHRPRDGYTLQINQPAKLAELSAIDVIADFRSRDIAAGGQGAPLVPAFHSAIFATPKNHRVILNLGGMANLTNLPTDGSDVKGFDCGPGNVLLDAWCQEQLGQEFDRDGAWAASGTVLPKLLDGLLAHPFLTAPPPKSCGREEFNLRWLQQKISLDMAAADIQATLLAFTAVSATDAIKHYCSGAAEVYVCGGGAHNTTLMRALTERLPQCRVTGTEALGLAADAVEACAFAWLAERFIAGKPGNLPAVTGARGLRRLGALYPA